MQHEILGIRAIVEANLSRAEAAKLAGLTDDAVRKSMQDNSATRESYVAELKALLHFSKARTAHTLIKELTGPNAAARVAAARTLLEENQQTPAGNGMPQIPGFSILITDARSSPQPIDVTPALNGLPVVHAAARS